MGWFFEPEGPDLASRQLADLDPWVERLRDWEPVRVVEQVRGRDLGWAAEHFGGLELGLEDAVDNTMASDTNGWEAEDMGYIYVNGSMFDPITSNPFNGWGEIEAGTGNGAPDGVSETLPTTWNECLDNRSDNLAQDIADLIDALPDSIINEYGALIWMDAQGGLHATALIAGDNFALTGLNGATPASLGFTSWSQVVGIVHSHPEFYQVMLNGQPFLDGNGDPTYLPVPEESNFALPSSGDWWWPDFLVSQGADAANFHNYIVFDGQVFEYNYYENDNTSLTGAQRSEASEQSEDYDPNETCP